MTLGRESDVSVVCKRRCAGSDRFRLWTHAGERFRLVMLICLEELMVVWWLGVSQQS